MANDSGRNLLADVHVVLLRPRWARNLGSVARAMKNFGLQKLTLVDSQIGSWADAFQMAVHADDVLHSATSSDDLTAVLAPARWIVGTTNEAPAGARVLTPREVAAETVERGPPTLLFGGEIHGLERAELLRCHAVSTIPTAPEQPSLNLAQAVCVYGAELFATLATASASPPPAAVDAPAATEMLQRVEQALCRLLESSRWARSDRSKNAIAQLMQPLYRAHMTEAEVHAWLVAFGKAGQQ